jgi:Ser/Thr protein kinase RdoA (MazF antagonist)
VGDGPAAAAGRAVTDAAVVGRILREYRLDAVTVRRRYGSVSDTRVGYEFRQRGGSGVLVRAYREDMPLAEHLRGSGAMPVTAWLQGRAATLDWLAAHSYPAPRLVRERTGDPVGVAGPWLTMAATFVPGRAVARGQLGLLGAALGRLHALPAPPAYPMPGPEPRPGTGSGPGAGEHIPGLGARPAPGLASSHPAAIPAALGRLDAVAALMPGDWRPLYEQFRATLLSVQRAAPGLPRAVVHGDAWPGNAVVMPDGQAALIDWENGGLGLPVVDLGNCLLECHLDPGLPAGSPAAWHIQPDPGRIAAVLDGYTRWRRLHHAEREILPDGIRFATAYIGTIHFERALIDGVHGPTMDARLAALRNRIAVSQAIADLAAQHLGQPGSRYAEPGRSDSTGA